MCYCVVVYNERIEMEKGEDFFRQFVDCNPQRDWISFPSLHGRPGDEKKQQTRKKETKKKK